MTFQESAQEIYQSMEQDVSSYLEYCKFVPNIDDMTLEEDINRFAKKEEPAEIICTAKTKSTAGIMTSLFGQIADNVLFTGRILYIGERSFKFSDIDSITYQEEIKTGLLGGKKKKSYLVVSKESGENEKFEGGFATESLAQFLDCIVKKNKENPPAKRQWKEFPRSRMIAKSLRAANFPEFQTASDLDQKKINSLIIHFGKSEPKASFIASYKKELFFSNDNLYSSVGEFKKIPYNQLGKVVYEENEKIDSYDKKIVEKRLSLLSNDGNVFFESTKEIACKEVADFFSKIISDATGTEVKTEAKTAETEFPNIKIIVEECTKRNLCKDYGWVTYLDVKYDGLRNFIHNRECLDARAFAVGCGKINYSSGSIEDTIGFFNDAIYLGYKKIAYDQIGSIICSKKFELTGVPHVNENITIYDKNGKKVCVYSYIGRGTGMNVANFFSDTIAKITGIEIKVEVILDDTLTLLNKWNEIFTRKNFIVDPEIKTETIEYVKPKKIEVSQYITDTAMLEVHTNETEVYYTRPFNEIGGIEKVALTKTEYYLKYYADKNNKDAYLLFRYGFASSKNFLKLEFKANGREMCQEKEYSYNTVLKRFVCLLDDDTLNHLKRFAKTPYTLTGAEREHREKLAKDKTEEERLRQEKDMEEKQQQHSAAVNDLKNF